MFKTVVTIIGSGLSASLQEKFVGSIKSLGLGSIELVSLCDDYAIDIFIDNGGEELKAKIRSKLKNIGSFDVFIQNNDSFRKKKLLIADMDATIVVQETLNEIAKELNLADKIVPITEKAMRGELDFEEALKARVALLKGVPFEKLLSFAPKIEYSKGAKSLVKTMNKFGAKSVLVSGGFDIFTDYVARDLGFYKNFGNSLEVLGSELTGMVIPPIVDKFKKEQVLVAEAKEQGCDLKHVMAVGDGANDLNMLRRAGLGVGYFAKQLIVDNIEHQIRYTDLTSLLYMQGYKESDVIDS